MTVRLWPLAIIACLLFVLHGLPSQRLGIAQTAESTEFEVRLDPKIESETVDGRLFVFLSERNQRAPRGTIEWFSPEPFLSVAVSNFAPGEKRTLGNSIVGFPGRISDLPGGKYYIHALLARSDYDGDPGRAEGNLFSQPVYREIRPGQPETIELVLDQVIPEKEPKLQLWMEPIAVPCPMLGEFHGREHLEPAMVILPPSYSTHPQRRYPVMYCIPSFNVTHLDSRHWQQLTGAREAQGDEVEFIRVVLNGQGPWGHHSYANSPTNGPRADSLVQELVPYIDKHYRTVAEPTARFLTGHSSGGWSSLWLQVMNPETFGGVWSSAPDPVDFRSYQGVNLYAEPSENVYITPDGERRRLSRQYQSGFIYWDSFTRMDDAYGRGGQLRAFEAVFSPLDEHGQPARIFDRDTGLVNRTVAEQWKKYDLRHVLQKDWERLKPTLAGKIHLLVGTQDTFFLEEPVQYLCSSIPDFQEIAEVQFLEGRTHMNTLTEQRSRRLRAQLSDTFLKHHRDVYQISEDEGSTGEQAAKLSFVQNRIKASDGRVLDLREPYERRTQFTIPYSVSDADIPDIAQVSGLERLLMPQAKELTDAAIGGLRSLANLRELDVSGTQLTDAIAANLSAFTKLQRLNLAGTKLGDDAVKQLVELDSLEELNLRDTAITQACLPHLARLKNLKTLDLSRTQLAHDQYEALSQCESLEILRLQSHWITEQDIQPLLQHPSLKELDVSGTLIPPAEVERLAQQLADKQSGLKLTQTFSPFTVDKTITGSPVVRAQLAGYQSPVKFSDRHFASLTNHQQLRELDLRRTQLSSVGLSPLFQASAWHGSLRKLSLQDVKCSAKDLQPIRQFRALEELNLQGILIGDATDVFTKLPRLEHLNLQDCGVTDVGVSKLQGLQQLSYLSLTNCSEVTDRSLPYLQTLRGLRYLYIRGTSLSSDGVRSLQAELPACFVYGDPRRWEYRWPNPHAVQQDETSPDLPPVASTARSGRILIDSRHCDPSWWLNQQPERFDANRDFHARSAWNMLRQQGYEVELIKPGEALPLDELASYKVIVRQRPWLAEEQAEALQAYRAAAEAGATLILELSPGFIGDELAAQWKISAKPEQSLRSVRSYRDEPLGRCLQDHTGPFSQLVSANPDVTWLAWLDKQQQAPVAGIIEYGQGRILFVGGPLIDADRVSPLVMAIDGLVEHGRPLANEANIVMAELPQGPRIEQLASPSPQELLAQPSSGYWQFQCIPQAGVQISEVAVHGPMTVSQRTRERDFRDQDHIHALRMAYVRSIPNNQTGRWFWQARARSMSGEWGPWSESSEIRVAPTAEEAAALLPPQPAAPETVPGMRILPVSGNRVQFLGDNSFVALTTLQGKCHVFYIDSPEPRLVTDTLLSSGFGSIPYIFGKKSWLVHLQPQTDGQLNPRVATLNRNAKLQPLLMKLDEQGQVIQTFEFEHSDSVSARYLALGRWLVTRAREDNRLWDLTSDDPTLNFFTIESPQDQKRMDPFWVDGRWMLAGDSLYDLQMDDPSRHVRKLPADTSTRAYLSRSERWLAKGRVLMDLQNPDWNSAVYTMPAVADLASVQFSPNEEWLLSGSWLIDLTTTDPADSALRLGIDDRTNTITFSPDGRWLFATSPSKIQLWDLQANDISQSMRETTGPGGGGYGFGPANAANVGFSPNNRWSTVTSYAGQTLIFDLSAGELKPKLTLENQNSYMSLNWSHDSRWLISGDSNGLKITDFHAEDLEQATETLVEVGSSGVRVVGPLRVSPNKRWLCFTRHRNFNSSNPAIKLWDLQALDPRASELELPLPLGFNGTFSPDSRFLAIPCLRLPSSGSDYQSSEDLVLFDLNSPGVTQASLRLPTHENSIREIRFSSDTHWLMTSDTKQTRLFDLDTLIRSFPNN